MKKLFFVALLLFGNFYFSLAQYLTAFNNITTYQASGSTDLPALSKAREAIDEAIKDERSASQSKTWYYRGLIYQLVFENKDLAGDYPEALLTASQAYQKAFEVSVGTKFKQEKETTKNLITASTQMYNHGVDLFQNAEYKNALAHFSEISKVKEVLTKQGIENTIDDENALFNATLASLKLEDFKTAKNNLYRLIERNYDSPPIYTTLANILENEKNNQEAKNILEKGIARYPQNADLIISQLNIYLKEGKANEVLDKMLKASELDPNNSSLLGLIGLTYYELKDAVKAEEYYNKAIEKNPKNFEAYNNLAKIYLDIANDYIQKMNDPKLTDAQYNKLSLEREKNFKIALPYLEKAVEINDKSKDLYLVLKEVYAKLGDYEKSKTMKLKAESL